MAHRGASGGSGANGAKTDPETQWFPFIDDHYPHLLTQTHFFPPFHFNPYPYTVATLIGKKMHVLGEPIVNPTPIEYIDVPDVQRESNRALERCLSALSSLPPRGQQALMVLSRLNLEDYLIESEAPGIALPTARDPNFPQDLRGSWLDLVLIHLRYGLVTGVVRSVGGGSGFGELSPGEQRSAVKEDLGKGLELLRGQVRALKHLVGDLPSLRVLGMVSLPNVSSSLLRSVLESEPSLRKKLCQVLGPSEVSEAVGLCMCQEDLADPGPWWQRLQVAGADHAMTEGIFKRLVARFCGPATGIDIPTLGPDRRVLRSWGDAVAEAGWRQIMLRLTAPQAHLVSREPEPRHVYLQGPTGTGKVICLFVKALQWAQQGRRVVCIGGSPGSRAQSLLMKHTICKMVPEAAERGKEVVKLVEVGWELGEEEEESGEESVAASVSALMKEMGPGAFSVVVIAVGSHREKYLQWLTEVRAQLPEVIVWAAGVYRLDTTAAGGPSGQPRPLPSWLEVHATQEALRIMPTVSSYLQQVNEERGEDILPYIVPSYPVFTQGPPVQQLQHRGQPGHSGDRPWQCEACGDLLYDILDGQLRVGCEGHLLQYRDIFVVYAGGNSDDNDDDNDDTVPRTDDVLIRQLQRRGVPTRAVTSCRPNEAENRELGVATKNVITAVSWRCVLALERRVVIMLGSGRGGGGGGGGREEEEGRRRGRRGGMAGSVLPGLVLVPVLCTLLID